jgi:hypothetical protein
MFHWTSDRFGYYRVAEYLKAAIKRLLCFGRFAGSQKKRLTIIQASPRKKLFLKKL